MSTDRELLELAAKAAGIQFTWATKKIQVGAPDTYGVREYREEPCPMIAGVFWNPLDDDGDRYRLAQKLRISIDYHDCCAWTRKHGDLIQEFWGVDCPGEAHVIVGVAAEIGRRMR